LGILLAGGATPALAQQPAPATGASAANRKLAREKFQEGEQAFAAGDFPRAGAAFEEAHRAAPHPSALWNAARAWHRAGNAARAANLYGRYLREAPADAPDRAAAGAAFGEVSAKVGRLEIDGRELTDLRVDEQPIEGNQTYVSAGTHLVRGRSGGREVSRLVTAEVGAVTRVTLGDEPATAPAPTAPATSTPVAPSGAPARAAPVSPATPAPPPERKGWSPIVVIVGASVTVFAGSWTVWSGLDTLKKKEEFDADKSQANLDDGKLRQGRTNLLIGTTAVLGTLTGLAAIFMVDWGGSSSSSKTQVGVGPGSVTVAGSF
jgi:tetratricopeptide (TPR) repeat protein